MNRKFFISSAIVLILVVSLALVCSCGGDGDGQASSEKEITAFLYEAAKNDEYISSDVIAVIQDSSISTTVPYGTDVTRLVATFTVTGISVTVGGTDQVSGITANDFSSPVSYMVTAEDGSTQDYTVTVTAGAASSKEITAFSFPAADNDVLSSDVTGTIRGTEISAAVPYGTDMTGLVAAFSTTGVSVAVGGVVQVSGVMENDFTDPVSYTVTAEDGSTQEYTVTVTEGADTVPPNTPVVSVELIINVSTPTWSWTVPTDTDKFRYQLNEESGAWTETADAGTTSFTPGEALADGTYTLYVQAGDSAGN